MENAEKGQDNTESSADITLDEIDFKEAGGLQKALTETQEKIDRIAGYIFRLTKEKERLFTHEMALINELDNRRKELIKRYKLDEKRNWKIDPNTKKIVYT